MSRTYLVQIGFRSSDPQKAAAVANATAEVFIRDLLDSREQVNSSTGAWLEPRIAELQKLAQVAERNVQQFRAQHNLVNSGAQTLLEEQLSDYSSQLTLAAASTSKAKAKLDRLTELLKGDIAAAVNANVLESPIIARLRQQYLDEKRGLDELVASLGETASAEHSVIAKLRRQIRQIEDSILDELRRLEASSRSDYQIAREYENSIRGDIRGITEKINQANSNQAALNDLESTARSYRSLYDRMLERSLALSQQAEVPFAEAHVVASASPPLRKSHPRSMVILAAAGLLGLAFGSAAGAARERFDRSFRSGEAISAATGLRFLGALPTVRAPAANTGPDQSSQPNSIASEIGIARFAVDNNFSGFANTIGAIKVAVDLAHPSHQSHIVGIVSTLAGEGKSTVAVNLAQSIASGGRKVLLIDGNLREPSLTRQLAPASSASLLDVLSGAVALDETVWKDPATGLALLPSPIAGLVPHSSDVISSEAIATLLADARKLYDYIVVDLPALSSAIDARAASYLVDAYVLVIEAGKTLQDQVLASVESNPEVHGKLLGAVLNRSNKE